LLDVLQAVANGRIGSAYSFTFSSSADTAGQFVQWYPDFPGCDASGDQNNSGNVYGIATLELVFEIYQAVP
jgi:hypothetical protein